MSLNEQLWIDRCHQYSMIDGESGFQVNFAGMNFVRKLGDLSLLFLVESPLVDAVADHILPQLAAGQLVQHPAFFSGIDHCAVIQFRVFFCQLCFSRNVAQRGQDFVVNLFGGIIIGQSAAHGNRVFPDAFRDFVSAHCLCEVHPVGTFLQFLIRFQLIQILPFHE